MSLFTEWLCLTFAPMGRCWCGEHPSRHHPVTKSTEILPGVQKPSLVLAQMICGKMLASLDYETKTTSDDSRRYYAVTTERIVSGDGYHIEFSSTEYSGMYTSPARKVAVILPVGVSFDGTERQLLWDTMDKVEKLKRERDAADEETKRQEKAVKAIADFFDTEEE